MLRKLSLIGALFCATTAMAILPDAVLDACLSPEVTEHATGKSWTIMTRKAWDNGLLEVSEKGTVTTISCIGKEHPQGWVTTAISVIAPMPTEEHPMPMQTLTVEATAQGILPKMTLDLTLIKQAKLPAYTIQPWGDRMAVVAEAQDWYLIADHPNAKVVQAKNADKQLTIQVPQLIAEGATTVRASLKIGEGPLSPPPTLANE